jgi:pimeloyl-ACP methyl ester carboxylesterase
LKIHFILAFILLYGTGISQSRITIYAFPGQGSDRRIFDSLRIDSAFFLKVIEYGTPQKDMTMNEFARQYIPLIDTSKEFILLGVSLGGMICVELNEILNPRKTIIISSAKNRNELPFRYQFQRVIPLYKIFTPRALRYGAKIMQPLIEPDRKKNKETFKSMLNNKDKAYMKRTIALIINWDRVSNTKPVCHIQGTKDHTIPLKCIKPPVYIINNGSHLMTLVSWKEVSLALETLLK